MKGIVAALIAVASAALAILAIVAVVRFAEGERTDPARCGAGFSPTQGRCCPPGQKAVKDRCTGRPSSCPAGLHPVAPRKGCAVDERRVTYTGGRLALGGEDWQADGVIQSRTALVAPFALDAAEVTLERWEHCVRAGACRALADAEPGLPVTGVDAKEAERFCRVDNGRLPTTDEWLFAAMGTEGRRFPWGPTGLVCRRAVFGLVEGPCARGGGAELAGSRPDGATPEGVLDLAGNVAEWTTERDGSHAARGGSYRSQAAVELKSFAAEPATKQARHIGFRCAYDRAAVSPIAR